MIAKMFTLVMYAIFSTALMLYITDGDFEGLEVFATGFSVSMLGCLLVISMAKLRS